MTGTRSDGARPRGVGGRRWLLALGVAVTLGTVLAAVLLGWLAAVTTYLLGTVALVGLLLVRRA